MRPNFNVGWTAGARQEAPIILQQISPDHTRSGPHAGTDTPRPHDVAVDIGGTSWSVATWRNNGLHLVGSGTTGTASPGDLVELRATFQQACVSAITESPAPLRVGVSFPGSVNSSGVVVAWPNRPLWIGWRLREVLGFPPGVAATMCDDGVAAILGEGMLGVGRGVADFLLVSFGTGIGGGVLLDRRVRPAAHDARTIGHIRALGTDRLCRCGHRGCLQTALETLPDDEGLARQGLTTWPDGMRLVDTLSDLARVLGVPTVVLTGGRLRRSALRQTLTSAMTAAGLRVLVPIDTEGSALLGAFLAKEPLP
ncbi:ROK family protein [Actinoplanes sp. NPDC020271]|uniref:ROK family protein n=1 Tax=Actinoplanes sp. NPDC020271 TaxID=3363896 RepID=UPI003793A461